MLNFGDWSFINKEFFFTGSLPLKCSFVYDTETRPTITSVFTALTDGKSPPPQFKVQGGGGETSLRWFRWVI